jgi:malate dehydrogenase (quinone)
MGEAKFTNEAGLIFNMTPSPGGTSCLGSGETDMRSIASYLGARIDERALAHELLMGYEDTRGHGDTAAEVETESEAVPLAEAV